MRSATILPHQPAEITMPVPGREQPERPAREELIHLRRRRRLKSERRETGRRRSQPIEPLQRARRIAGAE